MRSTLRNSLREVANRYGIQAVLAELEDYCEDRQSNAAEGGYPANAAEWKRARAKVVDLSCALADLDLSN